MLWHPNRKWMTRILSRKSARITLRKLWDLPDGRSVTTTSGNMKCSLKRCSRVGDSEETSGLCSTRKHHLPGQRVQGLFPSLPHPLHAKFSPPPSLIFWTRSTWRQKSNLPHRNFHLLTRPPATQAMGIQFFFLHELYSGIDSFSACFFLLTSPVCLQVPKPGGGCRRVSRSIREWRSR